MVLNEALARMAGVMAAALLHAAFFYALAVAQPAADSYAAQYAGASHCGAAPRAAVRGALA